MTCNSRSTNGQIAIFAEGEWKRSREAEKGGKEKDGGPDSHVVKPRLLTTTDGEL